MTKKYDVLDKINSSADVNELDKEQLKQLASDVS